jgi:hypothetical protein
MTTFPTDPRVTRLCRYTIASADMYFTEMEQRDVFVCGDAENKLHIWGEVSGAGSATAIDLSQVFLEYALYCCSWCSTPEAQYHMHNFGEQLGASLAKYLGELIPLRLTTNPAMAGLNLVLEAMHACHSVEPAGPESDLILADCALETAARHSGLADVQLAHHGINAMCQSLMAFLNPRLAVSASPDDRADFVFVVTLPVPA